MFNARLAIIAVAILTSASLVQPASSQVVAVSGDVSLISPPGSVLAGDIQSDTSGILFQEKSAFSPAGVVPVNNLGSIDGVYDGADDISLTMIDVGTVNSFLFHFDQIVGSPRYQGSVQFSNPIVGIIVSTAALNDTDDDFGLPGTAYPTGGTFRRGLDFNDFTVVDSFTISGGDTLDFSVRSSNAIDQIRVLTSVPEPSTTLFLVWIVALSAGKRTRSIAG